MVAKKPRVKKAASTNPVEAAPATVALPNTLAAVNAEMSELLQKAAAATPVEVKEAAPVVDAPGTDKEGKATAATGVAPGATPPTPPVGESFTIRVTISPAPVEEEGRKIVEDVGAIVVPRTFRTIPVCGEREEEVDGMAVLALGRTMGGVCGEAHMNLVLAGSSQIPSNLEPLFLAFLATVRQDSNDPESKVLYVKGLSHEGGTWVVREACLSFKWHRKDRIVIQV